jgi:hypothetical protein
MAGIKLNTQLISFFLFGLGICGTLTLAIAHRAGFTTLQ